MLEQRPGVGQSGLAREEGDVELDDILIETDFVVEYTGLSSNIPPEIDALRLVNDRTNRLTLHVGRGNAAEVIERLEELGISITASNFDLTVLDRGKES